MRLSLPVRTFSSVALVCLLVATASRAEEAAKNPAGHCRAEIDKLCPDSRPGSVERRACVRDNAAKLPADCQAAMRRGPSGVGAMMSACQADIDEHCADVRRGGGRLARCLRGVDEGSLSSTCQEHLDLMGGPRAKPGPAKPPEAD
jgi:hypothetical protein